MFKNTEPMYQIYVQLFALSVRSQPCIYYLYPVLNKYFSTIDILYIYMDRQIVHVSTYRQIVHVSTYRQIEHVSTCRKIVQ